MMKTIDNNLKSCAPQYDVYTYSFTLDQVKQINEALKKKSWLDEVRELLKEDESQK